MPATTMQTRTQQRVDFRNILFATDFSAAANSALPYAAGLARSFGAKLFALHVKEPANYALPPELWQNVQAADDREMEGIREMVKRDFPDIKPEILEGEGGVWPAMETAIKAHDIDLIVLGTRGRTGVGKALLGSQAEEVLRKAGCPVLTVGPHAQSETGKRGKIASVLYATDFGVDSLTAAPIAVSLAEEYQARLTLLHVVENREKHETAAPAEFGEDGESRLRAMVPAGADFWCAPHFVVEQGAPADKILEAARRANADLIVMGVHKPEGLPGAATHLPIATVHRVVAHAECPVLTVCNQRREQQEGSSSRMF